MDSCPYCNSKLNRPTHRYPNRTKGRMGRKRLDQELVSCPDCGGIIDGFSSH